MSLDECARWLADGRSTSSDGKNGAGKSKSKSKSKPGTKVTAPSKRKALGDVTNGSTHKSVKSVLNAKKALDVSGSTGGSSGKSSKSTPGSSGKKRGRQAPAFAVAAVDERGVDLGCSKCRYGRYGCATCRERAGVFETAVMIVESADDDPYDFGATTTYAADEMEDKENEPTAPAFKRAKRGAKNPGPRTLVPQSALAAANSHPRGTNRRRTSHPTPSPSSTRTRRQRGSRRPPPRRRSSNASYQSTWATTPVRRSSPPRSRPGCNSAARSAGKGGAGVPSAGNARGCGSRRRRLGKTGRALGILTASGISPSSRCPRPGTSASLFNRT